MPFAEFQPSNGVGDRAFDRALAVFEYSNSLMDRAIRRRAIEQNIEHQQQMQPLRLQQAQQQLNQNELKLQEQKRIVDTRSQLRERFSLDNLKGAIDVVRGMRDPDEQRDALTKITSEYAEYHIDPELGAVINNALGELRPMIEANETSKASQIFSSGRYAESREAALAQFPGYQIAARSVVVGTGPDGQPVRQTIWHPTDKADPQLERAVLSKLAF